MDLPWHYHICVRHPELAPEGRRDISAYKRWPGRYDRLKMANVERGRLGVRENLYLNEIMIRRCACTDEEPRVTRRTDAPFSAMEALGARIEAAALTEPGPEVHMRLAEIRLEKELLGEP